MAKSSDRRQPDDVGPQPDASQLSPNEQAVLSQQTAPNRTPSDQVETLRGEGSVGPGEQPKPADGATEAAEPSAAAGPPAPPPPHASRKGRAAVTNPTEQ